MKVFSRVALSLSLLLVTSALAFAQATTDETKIDETQPSEAKAEPDATIPPAVQPPVPVTPAADPTPPPPATSTTEPTSQVATVTAEAATEEEKKPWGVRFTFGQTLGTGAFVEDDFNRTTAYGWAFTLVGNYTYWEMLRAYVRADADWQLTKTSIDTGTQENEFYFRDLRLGTIGEEIYKEPITGITVGGMAHVRFPTSKESQAGDRVLDLRFGPTISKTFEHVGPGNLTLSFSEVVQKVFGPQVGSTGPEFSRTQLCSASARDGGDCLLSTANTDWGLTHDMSIAYTFLEDFEFTIDLLIINSFKHDTGKSELPTRLKADSGTGARIVPTSSDRAVQGGGQTDLMWGTISLAYNVTKNFAAEVGVSTMTDPFIQSGSDSKQLRFPFADFVTPESNITQFTLDLTAKY